MTVIAWDGRFFAADKLAGYGTQITRVTKIQRIGEILCGGAGSFGELQNMFAWIRGGRVISEFPETQKSKDDWLPFMVIEADKTVSLYERSPYPIKHEHKHSAIGSGKDFARACMHLGLSAQQAVEVTIELCHECGQGVDVLEHHHGK